MTLHLVVSSAGLASCLQRAAPGDPVVLMQAGVYATAPPAALAARSVYAIADDVHARGLAGRVGHVRAPTTLIDYAELVALVEQHTPVVTWAR